MLQESVNRFETEFVDEHSGQRFTVTFWRGEPVVYHPPHLPSAAFTHISFITKHYFVVGHSTTGRMVPLAEAQSVLQLKLSLLDVEREVHGSGLDAPERLLWRRWLEAANQRAARKKASIAHTVVASTSYNNNLKCTMRGCCGAQSAGMRRMLSGKPPNPRTRHPMS